LPDEDNANQLAAFAQVISAVKIYHGLAEGMAKKIGATGANIDKFQARLDELVASLQAHQSLTSSILGKFQDTLRVDIMDRLDRLQDKQTNQRTDIQVLIENQRTDMQALLELIRDSSPAALVARIRNLEDEIQQLRDGRDGGAPDAAKPS
jgi:hypothetical protein